MATARRKFLQVVGGGFVLAAIGAGVWISSRDPIAARRPWQGAGRDEADIRRKVLSFAILAPNPHNRQPWLADLSVDGEITLYCQADRRLPQTDPFNRQITIGLGCFLELLAQAAAEDGYRADISLFPKGEPQPLLDDRPVAHVRLVWDEAVAPDSLFAHVLTRRSNKEPYALDRPVDSGALGRIAAAARISTTGHTNDPSQVETLRRIAWEANRTELDTPHALKESIDLIRIGRAEIEANPDGIDLSGPFLEGLSLAGLLPRAEMIDAASPTFQRQIPILKEPFDTAMAFLWLKTNGNSRADQIAAGRDYVRLNLAATAQGVSMHPFSQALQEFAEMRPHFAAMRAALAIGEGETLQMFVRLGYGPAIKGAPRWPLENRIRSA
ncbi:MAG TPA: twin-arginine translocation pathway signal protein [Pararhizobium sp.]|uniref:Acg family FMN-binding oxidoreductase n=1 Tax=Pararhizobium sp. TaxID=1977563 RepID=UPI002BB76B6A|nr:twin-arginine translocation pathway signal protein [Pararhizobium sp.]HTO32907.1 twin-arginine translocation pathway signal protein [Pararhizobium sp.]